MDNMDSILISIKKMQGIAIEITHFDPDLIIFINGALFALNQLGVGPTTGFTITGVDETWTNFLGERKDLEAVKTYVHLKVRLVFDPPSNSFLVKAIEDQIDEYEWRICNQAQPVVTPAPVTIEEGGILSE